ncbi:MAG: hypothetical protein R6U84_05790 [Candidatus Cloacimonadales bacterium]
MAAFAANLGDLRSIQNLQLQNQTTQPLQQSEMIIFSQVKIEFPDKMILHFAGEEFQIEGDLVHRKYEEGYFEKLPTDFSQKLIRPFRQNIVYLAKYYDELAIEYLGEITKSDTAYFRLKIVDYDYQIWIEQDSFLLREIHYQAEQAGRIKKLLDYQVYGNIIYPSRVTITDTAGNLISDIKVLSLESK